jgi:DNA-binding NarL/FixJ family response regulator
MARPSRVLYVENHPTLRGIGGSKLHSSRELEVVATCADATEAWAQVDPDSLDAPPVDRALGNHSLNGTELGLVLRERDPNIDIVIFTQHVVPDFTASLPEDIRWG